MQTNLFEDRLSIIIKHVVVKNPLILDYLSAVVQHITGKPLVRLDRTKIFLNYELYKHASNSPFIHSFSIMLRHAYGEETTINEYINTLLKIN